MATANTDNPLHQLELVYDDGTTVSVVVCDNEGNPDPLRLQVNQMQRVAAKMSIGGVEYSDMEFPFVPVQQSSMAGGRGQLNIEKDNSKFADSFQMDTTLDGHVFLAPAHFYTKAQRSGFQQQWGSHASFFGLYPRSGVDFHVWQQPFTPAESFTAAEIWLTCARRGHPGTAEVSLYTTSGGYATGSAIASGTLYESDAPEDQVISHAVVKLTTPVALTADTEYTVVINVNENQVDSTNHWRLYYTADNGPLYVGDNDTDFTDAFTNTYHTLMRVMDEADAIQARYFRYKGALYAVVTYDGSGDFLADDGDPDADTATNVKEVKLFINGDQGVLDGATRWSITDSTKSWTPHAFKGAVLQIFRGVGGKMPDRSYVIEDNDADTLLLAEPMAYEPNPDAGATIYNIIGSDEWTELTLGDEGYGPRSACTDILVTHFCVYMCFGDDYPVLRMRRYRNNSDAWTTEWQEETMGFTFMEEAPNSDGQNVIWAAKAGYPPRVQYAEPAWANWEYTLDQLSWSQGLDAHTANRINSNSSCEDTGSWSDLGSPTTSDRSNKGSGWQGKYSWKIVADADGEGAQQDVTVENGKTYNVVCVVWIDTLPEDGKVVVAVDSTVIDSTPLNKTSSKIGGSWFRLKGHYTASASGTVTLKIYLDGGAGKFYFDEFEMVYIPQYLEDLSSDRITNLVRYGEPERLWVLTEGGIYRENLGYFQRIPLDEYKNAQDDRNGRVAFVYDVNLILSFLDGVQSYYRESLKNIGPDREEGLPANRSGDVSGMVGHPGRWYMAIDAGPSGYSSIFVNNGRGWHEYYRAPKGQRIRGGLFIQPVPGTDHPDRLWFSQGSDLAYLQVYPNPLKEA